MNSFISPASFSPISELIRKREQQIKNSLANLKAVDIRSEIRFEQFKAMIKKAVMLEPVVFKEPELISRGYGSASSKEPQKTLSAREAFIHRIAFPFTGSRTLFDYTPETFGYRSTDKGLVRPTNNCIIVEVGLSCLHLRKAILEARNILSLTMMFIASNNLVAQEWSKQADAQLDREFELRRKELVEVYKPKEHMLVAPYSIPGAALSYAS